MQVTVITDQTIAPVDLVYFLLGAGYTPAVALLGPGQKAPAESTSDYFLADTEGTTSRSIAWISPLPQNRTSIILRNPSPAFRKALQENSFITCFRFPAQFKELSSHLADAELSFKTEQDSLSSACFVGDSARFDCRTRELEGPAGLVYFTGTEAKALAYLLSLAGKPVSKERLEATIGSQSNSQKSRKTDVLISGIRAKLRNAGVTSEIASVRNVGYTIQGRWKRV